MKKLIKKIIIKLLAPIITKIGYVKKTNKVGVNELNKNHLLYNFFMNILTMGFTPKHIVDIGANHGTWTREALKYFPDAYYTLLEPQKWLKKSFQDILESNPKVQFYPVGAGENEGSFQFTIVDRDDSCSFRYTQEEAKAAGFKQLEIPVITLNRLLADSKLPIPDIIKIDAEGLDLEVLKGASDFFGKTEIFLIEAAVVNNNIENTVLKVLKYMDTKGYKLFEITDLNRPFKPKVLWLVELVFIKKEGVIDNFKIIK